MVANVPERTAKKGANMEKIFKVRSALIGTATGALAMVPLACSSVAHAAPVATVGTIGIPLGGYPYSQCSEGINCALICPMLTTAAEVSVLIDNNLTPYEPNYPTPTVAVGEQVNFGWYCDAYRPGCPNNPGVPVLWELQGAPRTGAAYHSPFDGDVTAGMIGGYTPHPETYLFGLISDPTTCVCTGVTCLKPVKPATTPSFDAAFDMGIMEDPAGSTKTNNTVVEPGKGYSIPFQINVVGPSKASVSATGLLPPNLNYQANNPHKSDSELWMTLGDFSTYNPALAGIKFFASGASPDLYQGQWVWVQQVINTTVTTTYNNGDIPTVESYGPDLDGGYPYKAVTGTGGVEAYDAPGIQLVAWGDPSGRWNIIDHVEDHGSFVMTLMWEPVSKTTAAGTIPIPPGDRYPVPVGSVSWEWDAIATPLALGASPPAKFNGLKYQMCKTQWCAYGDVASVHTNSPPIIYPQWNSVLPIGNDPTKVVECGLP